MDVSSTASSPINVWSRWWINLTFFGFEKFWNHLNWLDGGSPCLKGHSFFKGPAVTWFFSWPQLYFHKAPCVNAPSLGRLPHLVDVNAQGWLFASSISESCNWPPTSCISGSVEAFSSALCIYICNALFLFTSRVTVHNLQTPELLWWKQGQALPWIYHPQFPGGPGWVRFHPGGFFFFKLQRLASLKDN